MSRRTSVAVALGFALVLGLLVAALIAPRFLRLEALRVRIERQLSERLHGEVRIAAVHAAILPVPRVLCDDVSVSLPAIAHASIGSIAAQLRLSSLLVGRLELSGLEITRPEVHAQLPLAGVEAGGASPTTDIRQRLTTALAALKSAAAAYAPDLRVVVDAGRIELTERGKLALTVSDFSARAHLPPGRISVALACAADAWEHVALDALIDPDTPTVDATIRITTLRPQKIPGAWLPLSIPHLGDSEIDLTAHATMRDGELHADADASLPSLRVRHHGTDVLLQAEHLGIVADVSATTTTIAASDWRLTTPRARLAGELRWSADAPQIQLTIDGRDVDVPSVRQVAMQLAKDVYPVASVFDVLRAGRAEQLRVSVSAPSWSEIGDATGLAIRGRLADGTVYVPGVDLELVNASGNVAVADGALRGDHLAAELGGIKAHDGQLQLGLVDGSKTLQVDAEIEAAAAEVPPLLRRVGGGGGWTESLDQLGDIQGQVAGTLHLSGTTQRLATAVKVSHCDVSGRISGAQPPIRLRGGPMDYAADRLTIGNLDVDVGASAVSQLAGHVDWKDGAATVAVTAGASRLALGELRAWLITTGLLSESSSPIRAVSGTVKADSLRVRGPLTTPSAWDFELVGAADDLDIEAPQLRQRIAIKYPVSLRKMRVAVEPNAGLSFAGAFAAPDGLDGSIDLVWFNDDLDIKRLAIRDAQSDATLSLHVAPSEYDFALKGKLTKSTVDALVPGNRLLNDSVAGDFRAHVVPDRPTESKMEGHLTASDVTLPAFEGSPLRIEALSLESRGGVIGIDASIDDRLDSHLHVSGSVRAAPENFVLDLDLGADHIDWSEIQPLLGRPEAATTPSTDVHPPRSLPLRGTVRFVAGAFNYGRFSWKPLRGALAIAPDGSTIRIAEANLCGIATPGTITLLPSGLHATIKLSARNRPLETTTTCLGAAARTVTGRFNLSGELAARGRVDEMVRAARGQVSLTASDGRIYEMSTAAKVLSAVNIATGALRDIGDLQKEGIAYRTAVAKGEIKDGLLVLKEGVFDGPTLRAVVQGSVNLTDETLDLTLLVAPLKSVESVMGYIPGYKSLVGEAGLIAIPVRVTGTPDNLTVIPLDPATIGNELVGAMKKTLTLPLKMIAPVWPASGTK
ncbi:MAG TPA: AsmA-like C-terminal domain-containing protein [Candidatus Binatia bacterium]|nr:AsmA-like C-terminal domain-containing protein [Candidatus Binatia bacterium]